MLVVHGVLVVVVVLRQMPYLRKGVVMEVVLLVVLVAAGLMVMGQLVVTDQEVLHLLMVGLADQGTVVLV